MNFNLIMEVIKAYNSFFMLKVHVVWLVFRVKHFDLRDYSWSFQIRRSDCVLWVQILVENTVNCVQYTVNFRNSRYLLN